jgi:hypothetical protein
VFITPIGTPVDPRNDFRQFKKLRPLLLALLLVPVGSTHPRSPGTP